MTDPFVAEIRIVPFSFPPSGWAFCNGQLLPISQNTALFSLLGTTYGGDGKTNFALPDLRGSTPMASNNDGGALSLRFLGESGGSEAVTLASSQMPVHTHVLSAVDAAGTTASPQDAALAIPRFGRTTESVYASAPGPNALSPVAFNPAGNSLPHNNLQPYLVLNFIICMQGIFPPRP
jgi:microcystin-dependent protein